jgi:hypothetical protein
LTNPNFSFITANTCSTMRHLMPWRTERGRYFHAHPQQAMFSLIARMLLVALVVLALALSRKMNDHSISGNGPSLRLA